MERNRGDDDLPVRFVLEVLYEVKLPIASRDDYI